MAGAVSVPRRRWKVATEPSSPALKGARLSCPTRPLKEGDPKLAGRLSSCARTALGLANARFAAVPPMVAKFPLQRSRLSPPNSAKSSGAVVPAPTTNDCGVDSGSATSDAVASVCRVNSSGNTARTDTPLGAGLAPDTAASSSTRTVSSVSAVPAVRRSRPVPLNH